MSVYQAHDFFERWIVADCSDTDGVQLFNRAIDVLESIPLDHERPAFHFVLLFVWLKYASTRFIAIVTLIEKIRKTPRDKMLAKTLGGTGTDSKPIGGGLATLKGTTHFLDLCTRLLVFLQKTHLGSGDEMASAVKQAQQVRKWILRVHEAIAWPEAATDILLDGLAKQMEVTVRTDDALSKGSQLYLHR